MQNLTGHVRRIIRRQKQVAGRDFLRLTWTFQRDIRAELATSFAGNVEGISGVQIGPGATPFARMPFSARFCESERVNATIAPLVEE